MFQPLIEVAFLLIYAALLAAVTPYVRADQENYGVLIPGALAISTGAIVWSLLTWLGLPDTDGWIWGLTMVLMPVGMAFGGTWKQALTGGGALGLSLYLLFDKVLDVVLPAEDGYWLAHRIRETEGLSYDVRSSIAWNFLATSASSGPLSTPAAPCRSSAYIATSCTIEPATSLPMEFSGPGRSPFDSAEVARMLVYRSPLAFTA